MRAVNRALFTLLVFALMLTVPLSLPTVMAQESTDTFSIIQISDTQYLSQSYPESYLQLTNWIADNNDTYNVKMVVHTGDIVQTYSSATEWSDADAAMSVLVDAGIPYCWNVGNHDFSGATYLGGNYAAFNTSTFTETYYWVGSYGEKSTAIRFEFGNYSFMVICVAYAADASTLFWMNTLIATHTDSNIIVATHSYIGADGSLNGSWETSFRNSLASRSNVFLVLCGHVHGVFNQEVNNKTEILFDRQDWGVEDSTGADAARIYTFNLTSQTISVKTFDVYGGVFETDELNEFSFSPILIEQGSVPTPTPTPIPTASSHYVPGPFYVTKTSPTPSPLMSEESSYTSFMSSYVFLIAALAGGVVVVAIVALKKRLIP